MINLNCISLNCIDRLIKLGLIIIPHWYLHEKVILFIDEVIKCIVYASCEPLQFLNMFDIPDEISSGNLNTTFQVCSNHVTTEKMKSLRQ